MPLKMLTISAALIGCLFAQWQLRATSLQHRIATQQYEHLFVLPPPWALKLLSLGQDEGFADLLWARGLVYLGEEAVRNLPAEHVFGYGRSVVALDPFFSRAYRVFAISACSRPGKSEDERTQRVIEALEFIEQGVRVLPDDGELAWDAGALYAYTLAPRLQDPAKYREAKRRGLEHMQAAALRGAGPRWAGMANASTLVRLGQTEQAIAHLQELYAITSDPEVRDTIEEQLTRLRSEAFMEGLRQVALELERNHRQDFPYVSETMYLLLGKRHGDDRAALLARHFDPISSTSPVDVQPDPQHSEPSP